MNRVVLNIAEADGNYRGTAKEVRAGFGDYNRGGRLGTGVLASGTRSAGSSRHPTSGVAPARCAAHPEPSSSVEVSVRRGAGERDMGWSRRRE